MRDITVIGGGASGIMAAIAAARQGARVTILEQNGKLGQKLLATGNGRCNLSNTDLSVQHFHGGDATFTTTVLQKFNLQTTLEFFASIGLYTTTEESRIYPRSHQGSSLLSLMQQELTLRGVEVVTGARVNSIACDDSHWQVTTEHGANRSYLSRSLVLASGGLAAPHLGSDASVPSLLQGLGVQLIPQLPALVPLRVQLKGFTRLYGGRCPLCLVTLLVEGEEVASATGEIHWSKQAISGIPILDLSWLAVAALARGKAVSLHLNLLPELSSEELEERLQPLSKIPEQMQAIYLSGLVREPIAALIMEEAQQKEQHCEGSDFVKNLVRTLQGWRIPVSGHLGFREAQTTMGGVALNSINPMTMAVTCSKTARLYACGELLDVHGDCGGYNLQWAWSTGFIAGHSAARELLSK